jgi:hypothetical protein
MSKYPPIEVPKMNIRNKKPTFQFRIDSRLLLLSSSIERWLLIIEGRSSGVVSIAVVYLDESSPINDRLSDDREAEVETAMCCNAPKKR